MKRQIYVPFLLLEDGQIPNDAISLSKETKLGIQVGQEEDTGHDKIIVIEIPEIRSINYRKKLKSGFIQSIDYLDEYSILNNQTDLYLTFPNGTVEILKPRIRERHILIYRQRLNQQGEYYFSLSCADKEDASVLAEGVFEVI